MMERIYFALILEKLWRHLAHENISPELWTNFSQRQTSVASRISDFCGLQNAVSLPPIAGPCYTKAEYGLASRWMNRRGIHSGPG